MLGIGQPELVIVGIIALLLFGNKLPSVARSFGKSMTEFKKGISGVENEFQSAMREAEHASVEDETEYDHAPSSPKFVPPSTPPQATNAAEPQAN